MKKFFIEGQILANEKILDDVYYMLLEAPEIADCAKPGQFVHVKKNNSINFLRRPLGIAEVDKKKGTISLIYRIIGRGTAEYAAMTTGEQLSIVGPIGNGFTIKEGRPLVVGGGMGMAPLVFLAEQLQGKKPLILVGGKTKQEVFWPKYMGKYADKIYVTTDDGSLGFKGFTVQLLPKILEDNAVDDIYTCGPDIMMHSVARIAKKYGKSCQVSMEKRMACGIGVCLGCTFTDKVTGKRRKVCVDGPVFPAEEVFDYE